MWTLLCNTSLKPTKRPPALNDDDEHEMSILTKGSIFKLLNHFYLYQIYFNVVLLSPHLCNRNLLVRPTSSLHRQSWMCPICQCYLYPSICFFDTTTEILAEKFICSVHHMVISTTKNECEIWKWKVKLSLQKHHWKKKNFSCETQVYCSTPYLLLNFFFTFFSVNVGYWYNLASGKDLETVWQPTFLTTKSYDSQP